VRLVPVDIDGMNGQQVLARLGVGHIHLDHTAKRVGEAGPVGVAGPAVAHPTVDDA